MMVFADTSALIKHYIEEPQSDAVRALFAQAKSVVVARIAWAQAHAAMARRARENPADADTLAAVRSCFAADWPHYTVVEISQDVVARAGDYAEAFALRGYDSVQLAAARLVKEWSAEEVSFACFDSRLCKAAGILGLMVPFG